MNEKVTLKPGTILYDSQGHEIEVVRIAEGTVTGVKTRRTDVTYDADKSRTTHVFQDPFSCSIDEIGIGVFFAKEHADPSHRGVYEDPRYSFNIEHILEEQDEDFREQQRRIRLQEPQAPILHPEMKTRIIADYRSEKASRAQEEAFQKKVTTPYFARIDFETEFYREHQERYWRKKYYERAYISEHDYQEVDGIPILNWRHPAASIYYDKENTRFRSNHDIRFLYDGLVRKDSFNVYDSVLLLKRSIRLNPLAFRNLYIAGEKLFEEGSADEFLLEVMEANRTNHKIGAIIKSIQSNQNRIIREEPGRNLLVQGCAGSGKTMILLHRLSYLQFNQMIGPLSKVRIITPNAQFIRFFRDLTRILELDAIRQCTMDEYFHDIVISYLDDYELQYHRDGEGKYTNREAVDVNQGVRKLFEREWAEQNETSADSPERSELGAAAYYHSDRLASLRLEYEHAVASWKKDCRVDSMLAIAHRMNADTALNDGMPGKAFFDKIHHLCRYEIPEAIARLERRLDAVRNERLRLPKASSDYEVARNGLLALKKEILKEREILPRILAQESEILQLIEEYHRHRSALQTMKILDERILERTQDILMNRNQTEAELQPLKRNLEEHRKQGEGLPFWRFWLRRLTETAIHEAEVKLNRAQSEHDAILKSKQESLHVMSQEFQGLLPEHLRGSQLFVTPRTEHLRRMENDSLNGRTRIQEQLKRIGCSASLDDENQIRYWFGQVARDDAQRLERSLAGFLESSDSGLSEVLQPIREFLERANASDRNPADISAARYLEVLDRTDGLLDTRYAALAAFDAEYHAIVGELDRKESEIIRQLPTPEEREAVEDSLKSLRHRGRWVHDLFNDLNRRLRRDSGTECEEATIKGRHEWHLLARLHQFHSGPRSIPDQHLFIDEAQDYSLDDYRLLRDANGDSVRFNLFGDEAQNLSPHSGLPSWKPLQDVFPMTLYQLNENYRNTVEITQHVNRAFGFNLLAIGIRGPGVRTLVWRSVREAMQTELQTDPEIRIAWIVKDEAIFREAHELLPPDIRNRIFFGSVQQAKGLEFDTVYVIETGMTQNERYIAHTRALTNLIFVDMRLR